MGSSGGSGGGTNDWPAYMKKVHGQWLDHEGKDGISTSITSLINAAQGQSPYKNYSTIQPTTYFGFPNTVTPLQMVETFRTLNITAVWAGVHQDINNSDVILNALKSHTQFLEDELHNTILPEFKAGMRNINSVMTSAFVVGDGLLRSTVIKNASRFASEVQLKVLEISQRVFELKLTWYKDSIIQATEVCRIALAAQLDAMKFNSETQAKDKLWNIRAFEYGSQVMAAISGGVANTASSETSGVQNALGGAMAGAAVGTTFMPGLGTVIGGVAGLGLSFAK